MKYRYKYLIIIAFSVICLSNKGISQIDRSRIVSSYIYNFGNNVTNENNNFSEYKITLISSDAEIIKELTRMSATQKIQNKPIKLSIISEPNPSIVNAHLIFITNDKTDHYMSVFDMIEGKEILLISENFENKSYVMLKLYDTEDDKLLFEINKPNIINQNLKISDEATMMGGTEIDVASIYLKSQHSLRDMEKKLNSFNTKLDSLKGKIEISNMQVRVQKKLLNSQTNKIDSQKNRIDSQKIIHAQQLQESNEYKSIITRQIQKIEKDKKLHSEMSDSLTKDTKILQSQKEEIKNGRTIHNKQLQEIDSINNEIVQRNLILSNKDKIIGKQKNQMYLLGFIIFITVLFIIVIFFVYRRSRKKSKILYKQGLEIKRINAELNENNEELKSSLEEIKLMQQQLVQSEKMASLGVLSAGIAHEINNPINFVYAGINSLMRDFEDLQPVIEEISKLNPETTDIKQKLEKIEQLKEDNYFEEAYEAIPQIITQIKLGADRTAEIVKGLRSFSRTDKEELKYLNIHEGIDTSLLLLKNKYKNHIEIIKEFSNYIPDLKCNPGKINQAFLNIISNAIDAIDKKGKIWISTKKDSENIIISIKDNGTGIDEIIKEKLFDPFFTTKEVGKGTGLGLSITYGIITEHNGDIKVISEVGKGTEFIIKLPIT